MESISTIHECHFLPFNNSKKNNEVEIGVEVDLFIYLLMEQSCARKLRGLEHCLQLELLHLGVGNIVGYNALFMLGHSYKRNKVQLEYCSSWESEAVSICYP